jgi:acyl carrier protein phosphodiesterase
MNTQTVLEKMASATIRRHTLQTKIEELKTELAKAEADEQQFYSMYAFRLSAKEVEVDTSDDGCNDTIA